MDGRARAAGRQGIRGDHRLHLGDRGLWRVLHPQELWQLDRGDRRPEAALWGFLFFYASCAVLTWFAYTTAACFTTSNGDALPPACRARYGKDQP
ncbi:MAG: hypothetical protein IPO97_09340 [Sphingomonadales bacterium]|nr:hypothetical protein [Sphingomonadales bacterium]